MLNGKIKFEGKTYSDVVMAKGEEIMNDKEKERRVKRIRLRAVILKDRVFDLLKDTKIDMREELMEFFKDRFEEKKNGRNGRTNGRIG